MNPTSAFLANFTQAMTGDPIWQTGSIDRFVVLQSQTLSYSPVRNSFGYVRNADGYGGTRTTRQDVPEAPNRDPARMVHPVSVTYSHGFLDR